MPCTRNHMDPLCPCRAVLAIWGRSDARVMRATLLGY